MNYIYKNISGTAAKTLLSGKGLNLEIVQSPQNIALHEKIFVPVYFAVLFVC